MRTQKFFLGLATVLMLVFTLALGAWAQEPVQDSYEGEGFHFITGESFPTAIQVAGYDQKTRNYYLNYTLHTEKAVGPTEVATFSYVIETFNGSGEQIGTLGTFDIPEQEAGVAGNTDVAVKNSEITIDAPGLTAAYRVVVTVTQTAIATP